MKKAAIILVVIVFVGALSPLWWQHQAERGGSVEETLDKEEQTPQASVVPTVDPSLGQGGSSYRDPQGLYTVLYPNNYVLDTSDPAHIRVYYRGQTQRPQSEMSDGAIVVFETISLGNETLAQVVDRQLQQAAQDGISRILVPKRAITVGEYSGYTYTVQGLGDATHTLLQKSPQSSSALQITTMVSDPNSRGYQSEVDAILNTLQLYN